MAYAGGAGNVCVLVMFSGVGGAGVSAKVCVTLVVLVCVLVMVLSVLVAWIGVGGWCVLCCARGCPLRS